MKGFYYEKILSFVLCLSILCSFPLTAAALSMDQSHEETGVSFPVITKNMVTDEVTYSTYLCDSQSATCLPASDDGVEYGWFPQIDVESIQETLNRIDSGISLMSDDDSMGIIGNDDRVKVSDTEVTPYSAICYLEATWGSSTYTGTAFMIGDNVAYTI
ncbi:MAG: hypothetical protein IJX39_00650 [Clostridia bacterium]|nr:hypothetical protein [Clostridia bacterium]